MPREFCQPDTEKTKEQLLQEVVALRQQVVELEAAQSRQQHRAQLNRQRLNLVLQTSDIGIWFCDLPSLRLEWDAKCRVHFGLSPHANVTVKQFLKSIHSSDRKAICRAIQRAIQERTICDVTCCLRSTNEPLRWIRAIGSVFYDETGQPSRFDGITINVTEQKLQEEERDSLLYREQLARETAEAANRVKDEFLGVLSHELRSPLNPILGWSRLLQKRTFDPEIAQRALQTIERNAKLQTQLIEDLLDISRILTGKLTLNICAVDLVEVIAAALKTVQLAAEAKSIKIHTHFDSTLGKVAGDPVRLQQIVWNLLSNAIKFTAPEGWVEVKLERMDQGQSQENRNQKPEIRSQESGVRSQKSGVGSQKSEARPIPVSTHLPIHSSPHPPVQSLLPSALYPLPAHCAQLTISDTGRGINSEFLPYVFDYFRQANSTTTRKFGGLGLGLAIARHLVELHGGAVQVSSPGEGQGATFIVFLPLVQPEQAEVKADLIAPVSLLSASSSPPLKGVRVLVVDRQRDVREVVTFTLRQFGAATTVARSSDEALHIVTTSRLDVLLIDLEEPAIDGYELMRQIRTFPPEQGGQTPAIALTSYAGEYNQQQALASGFQIHLSKSVEPETLVAAIAGLVGQSPIAPNC